jgi:hypothetical protein
VAAGRKIRVQPGVIAKIPQPQMSQMHAEKMERGRPVREFFPLRWSPSFSLRRRG